MKFNRSAKSDKFDYMMLSRLIQDAKYFIEHPHLKHLWAKTLDEHIKQMKEQYAKLDPKPEWISLNEIEDLSKQMKESYKNYWNERHPDNKIEAASSKIKLEYPYYQVVVYDWKNDPIIEKDFQNKEEAKKYFDLLKKKYKNKNDVELYEQKSKDSFDISETYNSTEDVRKNDGGYKQGYKDGKYMYKNHQPEDPDDIHEQHSPEYEQGYWDGVDDEKEKEFYKNSSEQPTTPKPTQTLPDTMTWAWDPKANQWIAVMKDNPVVTPPTYNPNNIGDYASSTTYTSSSNMGYLKSSLESLKENPKFTSEIKGDKIIEDLFKNGFVQHAGYQRGKGTKISITNKGLDFLKKSYQEDYKKELKEKISLRKNANKINNKKFDAKLSWKDNLDYSDLIYNKQILASLYDDDYNKNWLIISPEGECLEKLSKKSYDINSAKIYLVKKACLKLSNNLMAKIKASSATGNESTITGLNYPNNSTDCNNGVKIGEGKFLHTEASDDNIDKKQTILKNLVYQHNKQNGEESAIGLSLDFDNKAVATGDLESLSKLEDQLRDEEIHCNITPRKDFPEMYELTVFYNTKGAPTDKFAALKKKAAENPIVFSERPEAIKFEIDENYLFKIINQHPKLQGIKLDLAQRDQTYTLEYKLSSEVKWDMWFDMRSWGIKEMRPGVMDQTISIDIDYSGEDEAPIKNGMYFSIEVPIKNIKCEIESRESDSNQFFLKELEIKEDSGKATF